MRLSAEGLTRSEIVNARLCNQMTDLQSYSMKSNIIINFNKKKDLLYNVKDNESGIDVARKFFATAMKIPGTDHLTIHVAHRVGANISGNRSLLVKLPVAIDISRVMSYVHHLKGTGHSISKQLLADRRERKQYVLPSYIKERENRDQRSQLVDEKLYVDGVLQRQYLPTCIPARVSMFHDDDIVISSSHPVKEGGSTFQGFAATVHGMRDVRRSLDKLMQSPDQATATHLMFAYVLDDPDDGNFNSDGDHGIGVEMLNYLKKLDKKQTILMVTRDCGPNFKHINKRRFEISINVCKEALGNI